MDAIQNVILQPPRPPQLRRLQHRPGDLQLVHTIPVKTTTVTHGRVSIPTIQTTREGLPPPQLLQKSHDVVSTLRISLEASEPHIPLVEHTKSSPIHGSRTRNVPRTFLLLPRCTIITITTTIIGRNGPSRDRHYHAFLIHATPTTMLLPSSGTSCSSSRIATCGDSSKATRRIDPQSRSIGCSSDYRRISNGSTPSTKTNIRRLCSLLVGFGN